jgi:hypothetical protein
MVVAAGSLSTACYCANTGDEHTSLASSTSAGGSLDGSSSSSSEGTTAVPFDASRWLGRYHYESFVLPFGEYGDPQGPRKLLNFEILADSRAILFHDDCAFEEPNIIAYEWEPDGADWLRLLPGEGETSLRFEAAEDLESLRVRLTGPCRELKFEIEGRLEDWLPFFPGESCWVDRCTTVPIFIQVDYCEGEEPPPCP